MHRAKFANTDKDTGCAAQRKVGPPDIGPTTTRFHTARNDLRVCKASLTCFIGQRLLQPRRCNQKDAQFAQLASSPSVEAKNIA